MSEPSTSNWRAEQPNCTCSVPHQLACARGYRGKGSQVLQLQAPHLWSLRRTPSPEPILASDTSTDPSGLNTPSSRGSARPEHSTARHLASAIATLETSFGEDPDAPQEHLLGLLRHQLEGRQSVITHTPPASPRGVIRRTPPASPTRRSSSRDSVFLPGPSGLPATTPGLTPQPGPVNQPRGHVSPSSSSETSDYSNPAPASHQGAQGRPHRSRIPRPSPSKPVRATPKIVVSSPATSSL